jgi:hypothetical protein
MPGGHQMRQLRELPRTRPRWQARDHRRPCDAVSRLTPAVASSPSRSQDREDRRAQAPASRRSQMFAGGAGSWPMAGAGEDSEEQVCGYGVVVPVA